MEMPALQELVSWCAADCNHIPKRLKMFQQFVAGHRGTKVQALGYLFVHSGSYIGNREVGAVGVMEDQGVDAGFGIHHPAFG